MVTRGRKGKDQAAFWEFPFNFCFSMEPAPACWRGRTRPAPTSREYYLGPEVPERRRPAGLGFPNLKARRVMQGRAFASIQTKTIPDFVLYRCRRPAQRIVRMDWADYLRDQATMYLQLAEQADDPAVQNEMLELASVCEEVANNMEDHLTPG